MFCRIYIYVYVSFGVPLFSQLLNEIVFLSDNTSSLLSNKVANNGLGSAFAELTKQMSFLPVKEKYLN